MRRFAVTRTGRIFSCFLLALAAWGATAAEPAYHKNLGIGFELRDGEVSTPGGEWTGSVILGSDTSTLSGEGYGKPNQSRIWFNTHRARWDALVPKNDGGASASDHYILTDVTGSKNFTGVELENRNTARPDVFWIDEQKKLFVLGSHGTTPRFWQLDYVDATDSYEVNPDVDGVTVPGLVHGPGGQNRPATLYVTPNGRVWAAVMRAGALEVQYSEDGGQTWLAEPVLIESTTRTGVTSWTHFTYQGTTYAGVFAAENGETSGADAIFYYWIIDQDADPQLLSNWTDDSDDIPGPLAVETADDHVAARRDADENQYFVVKTESGNPESPRIRLFKRTAAGIWSAFTVTLADELPSQTRPTLVIDDHNSVLYVYTTDVGGGQGRRVAAALDDLEEISAAMPEVVFSAMDKAFDDINAPRHPVNGSSGVTVLAHNETDLTVWYSSASIADGSCMSETGGVPVFQDVEIPQTDIAGMLQARAYRPDPALQTGACPLISVIPPAYRDVEAIEWAALRLAQDGYVVIVTEPEADTFLSYDRAARSGIDFMILDGNPWPQVTDTSRIGLLGGAAASSALTLTQAVDPRIDALVAWDNLAKNEEGDYGSPDCILFPGPDRPTKVPAMGQASDRCLKRRDAKKTAYNWWRSNDVETMQVVFARSHWTMFGPAGNDEEHDLIHYYTLAWFDRWLKDDPTGTDRLVSRTVLGQPVRDILDWWYRSAAFFDGYDCGDFRGGCSQN